MRMINIGRVSVTTSSKYEHLSVEEYDAMDGRADVMGFEPSKDGGYVRYAQTHTAHHEDCWINPNMVESVYRATKNFIRVTVVKMQSGEAIATNLPVSSVLNMVQTNSK